MIGLYFNREKVEALGIDPSSFTSIADVTAAFEKAKAAGQVPIMVGLADQGGDGGEKPWETLASAFQTPEQKYNWIAGQPGANINNPEALAATRQLIDWIDKGYFYDGGAGTTRDDAAGKFAAGESVFFISGSWYLPTIKDAAGDKIGYVRMPEAQAGQVARASGATSQPFGISAKSKHPDEAASFLDFLASDASAQSLFDAGQLPLVGIDSVTTDSQLVKDALAAWETLTQDGVLTLHTDWATPSMQNLLNPTIQGFYLGQGTPEAFLEALQADWEQFQASKSRVARRATSTRGRSWHIRRLHPLKSPPSRGPGDPPRAPGRARRWKPSTTQSGWSAYLYLAPAALLCGLFVIYPLVATAYYSFTSWTGLSDPVWVGLDNYRQQFSDPRFLAALWHAGFLMVFFSVIPICIGLLLAALLSRTALPGMGFFRTVLFLPQVIPLVAIGYAWKWLYAPEGAVNEALRAVGLESLARPWLGDLRWALPAVGVVGAWVTAGFCMVLFLAGIARIDQSLYDAARVDGAGRIREFFAVTLPGIRGELVIALAQ